MFLEVHVRNGAAATRSSGGRGAHAGDVIDEAGRLGASNLVLDRVCRLLRSPTDSNLVRAVNERLEGINRATHTAVLYILDDKGIALAASNWNEEASFVGVDLSYRPYFQEAMQHGSGRFYAIRGGSVMRA
jgi:C4-dicarboxylate-specific signal transduction histidine kinase